MPVPDISSILATTSPIIGVVLAWQTPLLVLILGIAIAFLGASALLTWIIFGLNSIINRGGKDKFDQ